MAGIRQYSSQFWLESGLLTTVAECCRIPASAGFQRSDVAGLQRRLDFDDRQLLNSNNWTLNVCVRTNSLISENNLRF